MDLMREGHSLFLEEIQEGLTVAINNLGRGRGSTSLLFNKNFGLKKGTHIVRTFVGHAHFNRLDAFIPSRRVKINAVAARMQIRIAILAFVGNLNLIHHLNFSSAVITARNQMELGFNSSCGSLRTRRRFRLFLPISCHISGLVIFSRHFTPQWPCRTLQKTSSHITARQ